MPCRQFQLQRSFAMPCRRVVGPSRDARHLPQHLPRVAGHQRAPRAGSLLQGVHGGYRVCEVDTERHSGGAAAAAIDKLRERRRLAGRHVCGCERQRGAATSGTIVLLPGERAGWRLPWATVDTCAAAPHLNVTICFLNFTGGCCIYLLRPPAQHPVQRRLQLGALLCICWLHWDAIAEQRVTPECLAPCPAPRGPCVAIKPLQSLLGWPRCCAALALVLALVLLSVPVLRRSFLCKGSTSPASGVVSRRTRGGWQMQAQLVVGRDGDAAATHWASR